MFQIQIKSSPDRNILGEHRNYKNRLSFGHKRGDILIADPLLLDFHLQLELSLEGLFCHKRDDAEDYLLDGKKTLSSRFVDKGSTITIGETTLLLQDFHYTPPFDKKEVIRKNLELIHSDPKWNDFKLLLERLEEDLTKLEEIS